MDRGTQNGQIELSATYTARPLRGSPLDTVVAVKTVRNGSDKVKNLTKTDLRR
jgi:hypothetical protein